MIHPPLWSSLTLEFDAPPPSAGHHHGLHVPPLSSAEPDDGACPITRLRASGFCRFESYAAHRFRQVKRCRAAECGLSRDRTTESIAPRRFDVMAVAGSLGGVSALSTLVQALPAGFPTRWS
jgi:hypothetical protein